MGRGMVGGPELNGGREATRREPRESVVPGRTLGPRMDVSREATRRETTRRPRLRRGARGAPGSVVPGRTVGPRGSRRVANVGVPALVDHAAHGARRWSHPTAAGAHHAERDGYYNCLSRARALSRRFCGERFRSAKPFSRIVAFCGSVWRTSATISSYIAPSLPRGTPLA
jgi:hypothetical protein